MPGPLTSRGWAAADRPPPSAGRPGSELMRSSLRWCRSSKISCPAARLPAVVTPDPEPLIEHASAII
eukprot:scaffold189_cov118-Isochrysis_galbana.AAC.16